ncbi:MAG: PQQ-binding-like beta-propeller repeat protein [Deltaproteobacteria bacterium]|nr:PQQ-binding-like beta-propeller repeat protein [Deltaproteobacteria bacterium]
MTRRALRPAGTAVLMVFALGAKPFGVELPAWLGEPSLDRSPLDWRDPVRPTPRGAAPDARLVYGPMYVTRLVKQESGNANVLEVITQGAAWNRRELASPVIDPSTGLVLVGTSDRHFYGVSIRSGEVIWKYRTEGRVSSAPVLDGENVLVGADDGGVSSLRKGTGHLNWRTQLDAEVTAPVTVMGDRVFAHTGQDTVVALRRATGEWLWQARHPLPVGISLLGESAPAAGVVLREGDEPLHVVFAGHADGTVSALEVEDGHALWNTPIGRGDDFLDVDADLAYDAGTLYAAAFHGGVHALDPLSGATRWSTDKVDGVNRMTVGANLIVVAGPRQVVALSRADGKVRWKYSFDKGGASRPVLHRGRVLVSNDAGALCVLNATDGRPLQYYGGKPGFTGAPAIYGNLLFLLSNGGWLHALSDRYSGPAAAQRAPW